MNHLPLTLAALLALTAASCGVIDEDNSDCGRDIVVRYRLHAPTDPARTIARDLAADDEQPAGNALWHAIATYTDGIAHDIDVRIDPGTHETLAPEANTAEMQHYFVEGSYKGRAVANSATAATAALADDGTIAQPRADTIDSHATALYTARHQFHIDDDSQGAIDVDMYMANAIAALVVDTAGVQARGLKATAEGLATAFQAADSTYVYSAPTAVRLAPVPEPSTRLTSYCVGFAAPAHWRIVADVAMPDGTTTRNEITIDTPLMPAGMKIVKMKMRSDGSLTPEIPDVGVSVTLDWKSGGTYNPEM